VPTLVVASARDRLLPSLAEAGRLVALIPGALRIVLPESGHTALLESKARPGPWQRTCLQRGHVWFKDIEGPWPGACPSAPIEAWSGLQIGLPHVAARVTGLQIPRLVLCKTLPKTGRAWCPSCEAMAHAS